jgi:hypothetical protein
LIYAAYIKEQVEGEEGRKSSLEQRGLAVVTTSGVLVTLLFGLTSLNVRRATTYDLPDSAARLLVIALVCFVVAALLALITNLPLRYQGATVDGLRAGVNDRWDDSERLASARVAKTRLNVLEAARRNNGLKSRALLSAIGFEILAVALVGASVAIVVLD